MGWFAALLSRSTIAGILPSGWVLNRQIIQRTLNLPDPVATHMRIDHRCLRTTMPKDLLDIADVRTRFQQMSGSPREIVLNTIFNIPFAPRCFKIFFPRGCILYR